MENYYNILEVDENASQEDIKSAYRRLSKEYHPDVNGGDKDCEEKFKQIGEAYSTLSDPQKKREYDLRRYGSTNSFGRNPFNNPFTSNPFADAGFSNLFNDMFGGFPTMPDEELKIRPIVVPVNISFEDSFFGIKKTLKIRNCKIKCEMCDATGRVDKQHKTCNKCNGLGKIIVNISRGFANMSTIRDCSSCSGLGVDLDGSEACFSCKGEGSVMGDKEVFVTVPPGLSEGEAFGMKGDGHFMRNRDSGDLIIKINKIVNKTKFERIDQDIILHMDVSLKDVLCEKEIEIPYIDGKSKKKKIDSIGNSPIIFEKEGFKAPHKPAGDFIVFATTKIPTNISDEDAMQLKVILEKYN